MINVTDARKGITIELDGGIYQVLDFEHIKIARGSAQVRLRLRDIRGGHTIDRTFQASAKFPRARVERQNVQFLYQDGDLYYFMNTHHHHPPPRPTRPPPPPPHGRPAPPPPRAAPARGGRPPRGGGGWGGVGS